jgi:hypothetical protein
MIPPDQEIYEVERRIALRRSQFTRHSKETTARAMQALASPVALVAAAAIGFIAAGGFSRKPKEPPHPERRKSDHLKAAKATGIAGVLLPAAMWLVRAQWGSPVQAAQALLQKYQAKKQAVPPKRDTRRMSPPAARP